MYVYVRVCGCVFFFQHVYICDCDIDRFVFLRIPIDRCLTRFLAHGNDVSHLYKEANYASSYIRSILPYVIISFDSSNSLNQRMESKLCLDIVGVNVM